MKFTGKALVTGCNGFIGTHMSEELVRRGWDVRGFDIVGGVDCRRVFTGNEWDPQVRYDLVVHCAAVVGGRRTIEGYPLAVAENLELDTAMFRWAVRTRQPRVVYFSSSAAYPVEMQAKGAVFGPLQEGMVRLPGDGTSRTLGWPDATYGWAKLSGEYLARFAEAEGVRVHVFRPFSGYGPGQALDYPFPAFIERAKRRADPFEIWGDGTQVRDFVHVDDIVATVFEAVDADYTLPLNIGTGRATDFMELGQLVTAAAGYSPAVKLLGGEPKGVGHRVADVSRLSRLRRPKIELEEGIRRALAS